MSVGCTIHWRLWLVVMVLRLGTKLLLPALVPAPGSDGNFWREGGRERQGFSCPRGEQRGPKTSKCSHRPQKQPASGRGPEVGRCLESPIPGEGFRLHSPANPQLRDSPRSAHAQPTLCHPLPQGSSSVLVESVAGDWTTGRGGHGSLCPGGAGCLRMPGQGSGHRTQVSCCPGRSPLRPRGIWREPG